MITSLIALALVASPEYPVEVYRMPDGLEVAQVRTPDETHVAIRIVVRVGAAQDPSDKQGLAHILERLVMVTDYEERPARIRRRQQVQGLRASAFTSLDVTTYQLEVPHAAWRTQGGLFLDRVTNPALSLADLRSEFGVVDCEAQHFAPRTLASLADLVLFPGAQGRKPVMGSRSSRRRIAMRDLMHVYEKYYVPGNAAVVVVGDVERTEVEALLAEHVHWPPLSGSELPIPEPHGIQVPVDEKVVSRHPGLVFGYVANTLDPGLCRAIAGLVELRLTRKVVAKAPLASRVHARCRLLRGHRVLLASVSAEALEGRALRERVAQVFDSVRARPATSDELRTIRDRERARLSAADVAALADRVANVFSYPKVEERQRQLQVILRAPKLDARRMRAGAAETFADRERIVLEVGAQQPNRGDGPGGPGAIRATSSRTRNRQGGP